MKKYYCLAYFLFLSCAISLAEDDCKKHPTKMAYRCNSSDGLNPGNLDISPKAVELDLSKNKLYLNDGVFKSLHILETLNLSHGGLSTLTRNMLKGLASLKTLDLSNNQFEKLPPDVFDDLGRLAEVRLQNNPLDCRCDSGLLTILTKRRNFSLGPIPAKCDKPFTFKRLKTLVNQHCEVNECLEENDCDDMATCTDETYAYSCKCTTVGFLGSGKECRDIDECAGQNYCSKIGGQCINTHGSYKCTCKEGFKGNGNRCTDIDECQTHDCDQGECTNTVGSFTCECHDGYEENDERVCVDADECKSEQNNTCGAIAHSYCFNEEKVLPTDDGYKCLCEVGYRQVGKSCVPEGKTKGLIQIIAIISGGFLGILMLIIVCTIMFRKWRNRTPKPKTEEMPVLLAPVVGLDPLLEFAFAGMPQVEQGGQAEEEWGELDDHEDEHLE